MKVAGEVVVAKGRGYDRSRGQGYGLVAVTGLSARVWIPVHVGGGAIEAVRETAAQQAGSAAWTRRRGPTRRRRCRADWISSAVRPGGSAPRRGLRPGRKQPMETGRATGVLRAEVAASRGRELRPGAGEA